MDHAIYQGTKHPELIGKSALVRPHPTNPDLLLAQFDDRRLVSETILETREGVTPTPHGGILWGFGWHELPVKDMPLVVPIPVAI